MNILEACLHLQLKRPLTSKRSCFLSSGSAAYSALNSSSIICSYVY